MGFSEQLAISAEKIACTKPGLRDPVPIVLKEKDPAVFARAENTAGNVFAEVCRNRAVPSAGQREQASALRKKMIRNFVYDAYHRERKFRSVMEKLKHSGIDTGTYEECFGGERFIAIMFNPQYADHYLYGMLRGKTEKEHLESMAAVFFENYLRMFDAYDHPEKYGNLLNPKQTDAQFIENYPKMEAMLGPSTQESDGFRKVFRILKEQNPDHPYVKKYEKEINVMAERVQELYNFKDRIAARAKKILNPLYPYFGSSDYQLTEEEKQECRRIIDEEGAAAGCAGAEQEVRQTCIDLFGIGMNDTLDYEEIRSDENWNRISGNIAEDVKQFESRTGRAVYRNNQKIRRHSERAGLRKLQNPQYAEGLTYAAAEAEAAGGMFRDSGYWERFRDSLKIAAELSREADRTLRKERKAPHGSAGIRIQDMPAKTAMFASSCLPVLDPDHASGMEQRRLNGKELAALMELSMTAVRRYAMEYQQYKIGMHPVPGRNAEGKKLNSDDRNKLRTIAWFLPSEAKQPVSAGTELQTPVSV